MSKVENNEDTVTSEPIYAAGYLNQSREDETDLVDLWIAIWSYRKVILSSVIIVAAIGIACFELLYNSKSASTVRSEIGIESIISNGKHVPIVDLEVLIKRIQHVLLPRISSLNQFDQIKPLIKATKVSRISKNSNIVRIVSKVAAGDIADFSRFHGQLIDNIMLELKKSAGSSHTEVRDTLTLIKDRIANLEGLIITLEQDRQNEINSQATSDQILHNQIVLTKSDIRSEIDLLTDRINSLELSLSNEGSQVLLNAAVSKRPARLRKPVAYAMIFMASVLLGLFATMIVIFARKVKDRMAAAE